MLLNHGQILCRLDLIHLHASNVVHRPATWHTLPSIVPCPPESLRFRQPSETTTKIWMPVVQDLTLLSLESGNPDQTVAPWQRESLYCR